MLYYLWMCESSSCPFELKGKMGCVSRVLAVLWLLLLGRLQPSAVLAVLGGTFCLHNRLSTVCSLSWEPPLKGQSRLSIKWVGLVGGF